MSDHFVVIENVLDTDSVMSLESEAKRRPVLWNKS